MEARVDWRHEAACRDLKWALESGQDSGVWGGASEDERRAIKRRAQRARARGLEPMPHIFETDSPVVLHNLNSSSRRVTALAHKSMD